MGQQKSVSRRLRGSFDSIISSENVYISSFDMKNNLGFRGFVALYLDNYFWKDTEYITQFKLQINTSVNTKYGNLNVQNGTQSLLFKNDISKSSDIVYPYLGNVSSSNTNESLFRINDYGQLFIFINGKEYQIYHINREATTEEQTNFTNFYKTVNNVTVLPTGYSLQIKDISGWRITESKDNQKNFVVRGKSLNIFPKDPSIFPPQYQSNINYDIVNWPFKITNTKPIETGTSDIGQCNTTIVGSNPCKVGVANLTGNAGYKNTSSFFYNKDAPTDQPLKDNSILVIDDSKFSSKPVSSTNIWIDGLLATLGVKGKDLNIYQNTCDISSRSLGNSASKVGASIPEVKCVNKDYVINGNEPDYSKMGLDKSIFNDKDSGRAFSDVSCWNNTSDIGTKRTLTMACTIDNYDPNTLPKPYKLITYDGTVKNCTKQRNDLNDAGYTPGEEKCNNVMIDNCFRSGFGSDCLGYLRDNIKADNSGNGLSSWLKSYCDTLTLEEKLSDKYKNFCGCYLTDEEYRQAKEKMLISLSQGNQDIKRMLEPIFQSDTKCWFPECVAAISVKTNWQNNQANQCPSNNFNFCIQKCEINNQGQMGNAACKNDATCSQIFNPPSPTPSPGGPTPSPVGPSPSPVGPSPSPTQDFFKQNKVLIISSVVVVVILLIIVGIVIIKSK